ncbi:UDP-N-acetylmuramoyl-tripeptide--D-alanyl-D-alanine ligase [Pontibacter akesuensis]|uniref:UDP-N-acetylmuramoyl-tripeptide--D-alanyl-D-alanine ligase n=1 Tax=Pontibacter akesuensis TaxID=388950 RepID=A0A1I7IE58_9BACT|nr:UDP-N-acetylmuramoyl-tripeptide--D-alanyl-D-alanine ligase [Pontibacter akesuensis]GHA66747.1 UDP-N-acetylmuramoyl-tripeptide--D-alanyl-D-alanine ligase [Pontibacter akesuensis]SFU71239.1 UDP-N-acetylmuramoyl-tripeptide--D-alanyl-D-alanine ligase [Pontibacter akesuensis]
MQNTIEFLYQKYQECQHVSTDSRAAQHQSLFFALNGPNFKGAQFAQMALEKGANYAVVDDPALASDKVIVVEDTLVALQELARHHRRQLSIPIIGITGSNGKTTSKELVHAVLSQKYNTLYTQGNLNNHIGVPLTLLRIKPEHEMAIIEMGANHIGEIALLCSIALPSHGFITNIGKAHLEGFGSLEGVARGKSELYVHLLEHGGTVFVNTQNEHLMRMSRRIENKVTYPAAGDYYHSELLEASPYVVYKDEEGNMVHTQLVGSYNYENMAAAACIGKFFGVPLQQANDAIASYSPVNNRSQVVQQGSNTLILDAYNANPTSMAAAVRNFGSMAAPRKVVILGDMFELGVESEAEHRALGETVAEQSFDTVILCGKDMQHAASVNEDFLYFETKPELQTWLRKNPIAGSYVLIKGSRGMGLETLTEVLA